ncbi:MAG: DUF2520 domain-containing protein [Firmicutes bacterium]|nr:DUF2520 domain-containing protein [Bacillota bacterium]MBU4553576.1 DUF2520 domain-containing protein [Bacillota bacterium]MBV1727206.1 DUF2520 domain-containing protein [Desulforudis sp.]MBV1734695.1 DUF2520 domain-containing protein [Desulforudis sp.]MBV1770444.1 DUF2520 domain-containing protein [Desulforudis sp.]
MEQFVPRPRVAIIGAGKVGSALGMALYKCGYPITGVASRSLDSAERLAVRFGARYASDPCAVTSEADLVFITTPDREIRSVAADIAYRGGFHRGQIVVHTSGALTASELAPARAYGAAAVSVHPLQSFAATESGSDRFKGCYFAVEGDVAAMPVAEQVVADLGGVLLRLKADDKALYHAAACVASNYLVVLIHLASGILERCGLDREHGLKALVPLLDGTLQNIKELGATEALTGPVARGDVPTLQWHLDAFGRSDAVAGSLYRHLGLYALEVAREKGTVGADEAMAIERLLEGVEQSGGRAGYHRPPGPEEARGQTHYHAYSLRSPDGGDPGQGGDRRDPDRRFPR